jgi:hypothetical protein
VDLSSTERLLRFFSRKDAKAAKLGPPDAGGLSLLPLRLCVRKTFSAIIRLMKTLIPTGLLILVLVVNATAQNAWSKKYTEWSQREVSRILDDSPWSRTDIKAERGRYRPDSPDYPPELTFMVQIRLYSALTVRQALVRRMQLTIPYAELTVAQRANFDAEVDGLLKCPLCSEHYIVTLRSSKEDRLSLVTRGSSVAIDAVAMLKRLPEDELLLHVSLLNDKGDRRNATRVVFTPRNEVVFLFRRLDDQGNPLITATNKKFYVDFDEYFSKKAEGVLKKFTFDVKPLVHDDEVVF